MRNATQLIAYADRLAGSLAGLAELLDGPLDGLFGGVHVLPFFTPIDGADAGFDPTDHTAVDPRMGSWDDVAALSRRAETVVDLIVNHVSDDSPEFRDVLARGTDSQWAGMFLTFADVFPDGATEADLLRLYRPRPGLPLVDVTFGDRSRRILWATFTEHQMDLDVSHPRAQGYLRSILDRFAAAGVRVARLDAVGYAVKTPGTSCFMTPETFAFIAQLRAWARERGIETLVEVHAHYEQQIAVAAEVDWVYDFVLAPLVLHALFTGEAGPLRHWLDVRPTNAVTVLDTHDGIGVLDVGSDPNDRTRAGLLDDEAIDALVERIHEHTGGQSRQATGAAASNVDLYQVNTTYYDALGGDDDAYLLARLIQLLTPGVPQIYYVGLLAGRNDMELLAATGVGRDINRHRYTREEIEAALATPVVERLCGLIRFRNRHPAFGGRFELGADEPDALTLRWIAPQASIEARLDLAARRAELTLYEDGAVRTITDLAELAGA